MWSILYCCTLTIHQSQPAACCAVFVTTYIRTYIHTICDTQPCCIKEKNIFTTSLPDWMGLLSLFTEYINSSSKQYCNNTAAKVSLTKIIISVDPQLSYCANQIKQKQEPDKK